jgi:hypothetical protein
MLNQSRIQFLVRHTGEVSLLPNFAAVDQHASFMGGSPAIGSAMIVTGMELLANRGRLADLLLVERVGSSLMQFIEIRLRKHTWRH